MATLWDYLKSEGLMSFGGEYYFGNLKGYTSAIFFTPGGTQLTINTRFSDKEHTENFNAYLHSFDLKTQYHIYNYHVAQEKLCFMWSFFPDEYSVEEISAFIEWLYPILKQYHASEAHTCTECGKEITHQSGHWYMTTHNRTAHYIHSACRGSLMQKEQQASSWFRKNKIPTYKAGFLWALLFSLPGTILWGLLVTKSDVVPVIGIFIGLLGWLGYTIAPGRRGGIKLLLLFASTLLSLIAGTGIAGLAFTLSGHAVNTVLLAAYTFIGFILGLVILLAMHFIEFIFLHDKMTGVIDLE